MCAVSARITSPLETGEVRANTSGWSNLPEGEIQKGP